MARIFFSTVAEQRRSREGGGLVEVLDRKGKKNTLLVRYGALSRGKWERIHIGTERIGTIIGGGKKKLGDDR